MWDESALALWGSNLENVYFCIRWWRTMKNFKAQCLGLGHIRKKWSVSTVGWRRNRGVPWTTNLRLTRHRCFIVWLDVRSSCYSSFRLLHYSLYRMQLHVNPSKFSSGMVRISRHGWISADKRWSTDGTDSNSNQVLKSVYYNCSAI